MGITVKGVGKALSQIVDDIEDSASKAGKKVADKSKDVAKKLEDYVPPAVKKGVDDAKDYVEKKTSKVKEYGKKIIDAASEDDDYDKFVKQNRRAGRTIKEYTRKTGRYHYKKGAEAKGTSGVWYEDAKDRLDKKQVAKDAGKAAALAGLGVGAVKANEKISETFGEAGAEDMVTQIKRKMRDGKELTQSEKRLLRLMEA